MKKLTLQKATIRNIRVRSDIRAGVAVPGDTANAGPSPNSSPPHAPPGSVGCDKEVE